LISFRPALHLAKRACRLPEGELEALASERWMIAPGETRYNRPAKFLPAQLDRIQATEFGTLAEVIRDFKGDFEVYNGPTLGYRLKHVDYVDGVLYAPAALKHLRPRSHKYPAYLVPTEAVSGALYESWIGNRWFGTWLSEDCLAYPLAEMHGAPVATTPSPQGHATSYEVKLGHRPRRIASAHFNELILFSDGAHNAHKKARADQLRARLVAGMPGEEHPGVFLLRGTSGMRRLLENEREIADRMAATRGLRVLDPATCTVDEIITACAGARIVMGVEGSQLVHGLMVMPPEAMLFVIQPPDRAVSALKIITDRQGQRYAFVVGQGNQDGFSANLDEIERTLDLAPV
jgi:hypothetical protein